MQEMHLNAALPKSPRPVPLPLAHPHQLPQLYSFLRDVPGRPTHLLQQLPLLLKIPHVHDQPYPKIPHRLGSFLSLPNAPPRRQTLALEHPRGIISYIDGFAGFPMVQVPGDLEVGEGMVVFVWGGGY